MGGVVGVGSVAYGMGGRRGTGMVIPVGLGRSGGVWESDGLGVGLRVLVPLGTGWGACDCCGDDELGVGEEDEGVEKNEEDVSSGDELDLDRENADGRTGGDVTSGDEDDGVWV